jgi:uncharacterized protein YgiM (DUF1202 family)
MNREVLIMSGYSCSNCGVSLADSDTTCPECGMPRVPRGEGPLVEADVKTDLGGEFRSAEKAGQAVALRGAVLAQSQGGKGKIHSKKKSAGFSRTVSSVTASQARKKMPRNGPFMYLILIFAIAWIGGMAFLAYRFFIPKDVTSESSVAVVYPDSGVEAQPQIEQTPAEPAIQPLTQEDAIPQYVWSDADARGYSNLVPSDAPSAAATGAVLNGTVLGDRVRLRSEPNTNSKIINHHNKGVKVEIMRRYTAAGDEYPWYNIKVKGRVGWMYGQYIGDIK